MKNYITLPGNLKRFLLLMAAIFSVLFYSSAEINDPASAVSKNSTEPDSGYVILTNYNIDSPYFSCVKKLSDYRNGIILHFDDDILAVSDTLKKINPRYVAVITSPEIIDEAFAYKIFNISKQSSEDYKTEFSYGFISGNSPDEIDSYIDNVIAFENGAVEIRKRFNSFWSTAEGAAGGGFDGWGDNFTQTMVNSYNQLGYISLRLDVAQWSHQIIMNNLKESGIIHFLLHGHVSGVSTIFYDEIPVFTQPVVVFNHACYGGCTSKWYNQNLDVVENYEERAGETDPQNSFALIFLKNGALAYYGHMCMWGDNSWVLNLTDSLKADINRGAGDLLTGWYNIPDGPRIYKESDIASGAPEDLLGMDENRFWYAGIVLYGDPAVKFNSTVTTAGGQEAGFRGIEIYPNPVTSELHIRNLPKECCIELHSLSGQIISTVKAVSEITLNTEGLQPGVYLLKIRNKRGTISVHKIVKR